MVFDLVVVKVTRTVDVLVFVEAVIVVGDCAREDSYRGRSDS